MGGHPVPGRPGPTFRRLRHWMRRSRPLPRVADTSRRRAADAMPSTGSGTWPGCTACPSGSGCVRSIASPVPRWPSCCPEPPAGCRKRPNTGWTRNGPSRGRGGGPVWPAGAGDQGRIAGGGAGQGGRDQHRPGKCESDRYGNALICPLAGQRAPSVGRTMGALGFRPRRMPVSGKGGRGHGPADVTQGQGVSVAFSATHRQAGRCLALPFRGDIAALSATSHLATPPLMTLRAQTLL
jgi:hypothetical protein